MEIPEGIKSYDLKTAVIFFDGGTLYAAHKPGAPIFSKEEEIVHDVNSLLQMTGGEKVYMVLETNAAYSVPAKTRRKLVSTQLARAVKAIAIVVKSPLSKMVWNLIFNFSHPPYHMHLVNTIEEGKEWIEKQRQKEAAHEDTG